MCVFAHTLLFTGGRADYLYSLFSGINKLFISLSAINAIKEAKKLTSTPKVLHLVQSAEGHPENHQDDSTSELYFLYIKG